MSSPTNIYLHKRKSATVLEASSTKYAAKLLMFWLNEHWFVSKNTSGNNSQSPLREELQSIGKLHPQGVLLIDDALLCLYSSPEPHRFTDWPYFQYIYNMMLVHPENIQEGMPLYAPRKEENRLFLANNSRRFELQQLRNQTATQTKRKSLWQMLHSQRN